MPLIASRRARAVAGIAASLTILAVVGFWLRTSSLVRVKEVAVTGIDGRQAGAIRDALVVAARDMTTLAVDERELLASVAAYPVVRRVRASADFPHRLRIEVDAFEPVAAVQARGTGATIPVARDGTLLRGTATTGLPVVVLGAAVRGDRVGDARARATIRLLAAAPAPLRARVRRVFRTSRGVVATVDDGPRIYFGGAGAPRAKWAAAARVLADEAAQGAAYVDVRIPQRPVAGGFQPRPASASTSTLG